jgi:hypothetical protein
MFASDCPHVCQIAIDLIDCDLPRDLFKELKLGVRTEMVEQMIVEPSWFGDI